MVNDCIKCHQQRLLRDILIHRKRGTDQGMCDECANKDVKPTVGLSSAPKNTPKKQPGTANPNMKPKPDAKHVDSPTQTSTT